MFMSSMELSQKLLIPDIESFLQLSFVFLKFNSLGEAPGVHKFQIWGQAPVRPRVSILGIELW
jgi:hypothetical protein